MVHTYLLLLLDWAVDAMDLRITKWCGYVDVRKDQFLTRTHTHDCRCHTWSRGQVVVDDWSCVERVCLAASVHDCPRRRILPSWTRSATMNLSAVRDSSSLCWWNVQTGRCHYASCRMIRPHQQHNAFKNCWQQSTQHQQRWHRLVQRQQRCLLQRTQPSGQCWNYQPALIQRMTTCMANAAIELTIVWPTWYRISVYANCIADVAFCQTGCQTFLFHVWKYSFMANFWIYSGISQALKLPQRRGRTTTGPDYMRFAQIRWEAWTHTTGTGVGDEYGIDCRSCMWLLLENSITNMMIHRPKK